VYWGKKQGKGEEGDEKRQLLIFQFIQDSDNEKRKKKSFLGRAGCMFQKKK